jgi:hypothetical protein
VHTRKSDLIHLDLSTLTLPLKEVSHRKSLGSKEPSEAVDN